jgi:hypothetical protein
MGNAEIPESVRNRRRPVMIDRRAATMDFDTIEVEKVTRADKMCILRQYMFEEFEEMEIRITYFQTPLTCTPARCTTLSQF